MNIFVFCQVAEVGEDVFGYEAGVTRCYHFDLAELETRIRIGLRQQRRRTCQLNQSFQSDRADLRHLVSKESYHIRYDTINDFLVWYEIRNGEKRLERLDAGRGTKTIPHVGSKDV